MAGIQPPQSDLFHQLMTEIRAHILNGTFLKYYQERCTVLSQADPENPMGAKPKRPNRQSGPR